MEDFHCIFPIFSPLFPWNFNLLSLLLFFNFFFLLEPYGDDEEFEDGDEVDDEDEDNDEDEVRKTRKKKNRNPFDFFIFWLNY